MSGREDRENAAAERRDEELYVPAAPLTLTGEATDIGRFVREMLRQREIRWGRRIVLSAIGLILLVAVYSAAYQWMLLTFEGVEVSITDAFQVVVEAFTTAGFGGDTDYWNTHAMNLFVVFMNLTGVLLVFIALPVFVFPLLRESLEDRPPEHTELTDHLVVCSRGQRQEELRRALGPAGIPFLIVDNDPETILELDERGLDAMLGDPTTEETLRAANVTEARALITDVSERDNLAVVLTARDLNEEITIVSVVEGEAILAYHRDAGADHVIRPSQALARSLARKSSPDIVIALGEAPEVEEEFTLTEWLITEGSDLVGTTLADSGLSDRLGATVIGIWAQGGFIPAPDPEVPLAPFTILLVAGRPDPPNGVVARPVDQPEAGDHVVVAGADVVGRNVVDALEAAGVSQTTVDAREDTQPDIFGDITDHGIISEAAVADARSIVLSLADDTTTMYAGVALRRAAPGTEVLARAHDPDNVSQIYRAGAHYVLTLPAVTGRMIARILIGDEEVAAAESPTEVLRTDAPQLVGWTLGGVNIRQQTGALVVAIERDGELLTSPPTRLTITERDVLIAVGSPDALERFEKFTH